MKKQILHRQKLELFLKYCAIGCGIKLKKITLRKVPEIEVCFDVYYKGKKICYLLKQWGFPMLRFGNTIVLRKDYTDFKERSYKIHHICAVNFITIMFPPPNKKIFGLQMSLETAVDIDNFNERVFKNTVERFKTCIKEINQIIKNRA